jgi:hypothetical protein
MKLRFDNIPGNLQVRWNYDGTEEIESLPIEPILNLSDHKGSINSNTSCRFADKSTGTYNIRAKRSGNAIYVYYTENSLQPQSLGPCEGGKTIIEFSNASLEKIQRIIWVPKVGERMDINTTDFRFIFRIR